MTSDKIVAELNTIAGKHGVGRVDIVENRLVGMKSRGCYETPGGTVIFEALRGLEQLVLDRETLHYREQVGLKFAELVYNGQWFTPLREALWAFVDKVAQRLTGDVVVRLHKGTAVTTQRRSLNSLYSESFATFDKDEVYNQAHAEGFIRLFSLPARIAALTAANPGAGAGAKPARKEKVRT
jgi:argininosuccinate synthase